MSFPNLFKYHSVSDHANSIASYLPGGKVFESKNIIGTNIRNFIEGLSVELKRVETELINFSSGMIVDSGNNALLEEWEKQIGIPDDCFPGTGTIAVRESHVVAKLLSFGAQTAADFEAIALALGLIVTVEAGEDNPVSGDVFTFTFPFTYSISTDELKFVITVEYATLDDITVLECFFNKIKPAHCLVVFIPV